MMKQNFGEISIEEAIAKGRKVNLYAVAAIAIINFPVVPLVYKGIITLKGYFISIPLGILLFLLIRSIMMPKWKIWALEHVQDAQKFKRVAQEKGVWLNEKSLFTKLEYWSASDKEKYRLFESKLSTPEGFKDDSLIGPSTELFYNHAGKPAALFIALVFLYYSFDNLYHSDYIYGLICFLISVYALYHFWKFEVKPEAQLIFSEKGITINENQFYPWSAIKDEKIESVKISTTTHYIAYFYRDKATGKRMFRLSRRNFRNTLKFTHPMGTESVDMRALIYDEKKIHHLLEIYRERYTQSLQSKSRETKIDV
ncbi:MAG: hypothetical protein ACK5JC_11495 [Bacteroidota bacterium]|jgi:hypothetical protein